MEDKFSFGLINSIIEHEFLKDGSILLFMIGGPDQNQSVLHKDS